MSGSLYDPAISRLMQTNPELAAIERRRMLAAMLMQQGQQNQKITHPLQIAGNLANTAVAALMTRKADEESKALTDQWRADDKAHWSVTPTAPQQGAPSGAMPDATPAGPMTAPPPGPVQQAALPPISDVAARVLYGEAVNQGPEGLAAVAHVIRNRANLTGLSPDDVVQKPGQFESWGNPQTRERLAALKPEQYAQAKAVMDDVMAGRTPDPTGGATHFLNPDLQQRLRRPLPDWAPPDQGQRIGQHVFYSYPGDFKRTAPPQGGESPQIAANSPPPSAPASDGGGDNMPIPGLPGMTLGTLTTRVMQGMNSENPYTRARAEKYIPMLTQLRQQQALALQEARAERGQIPQGYRFNRDTGQLEQIPGAPTTSGLQPIYGYSKDNQLVVMFPDGRGGVTQAQVPDNVTLAPPTRDQNLGTSIQTVGPGGRPIARAPIDVAGKASAAEVGKAAGTESAGAESAYRTATQTLQNIDGVLNHPGIRMGTGMSSVLNAIPGTDGYDFALRVEQLKGQAFLQAFNTLKGGGAITEAEGAKATAAIARLNTRLGTADFKTAVQELRDIVAAAQERAKAKMPAPAAAPGAAPNRTFTWNPQTGELE